MSAGLGSCNTLALLSVHRYIIVSLPTQQQWLSTNLSLACGVLIVTSLTLAVSLPPLLGIPVYSYHKSHQSRKA